MEADDIARFNGEKVQFVARVVSEIEERQKNSRFEVAVESVIGEKTNISVGGKVLITTEKYVTFSYGERLVLTCNLKKPEPFNGFAYDRYLARFGIYSLCGFPRVQSLGFGDMTVFTRLQSGVFSLKNRLRVTMNHGLTEPESGLLRAILFGDKNALDEDLRASFSVSGLSHLTAISGLNITILVFFLQWLFISVGFWRKQAFYLVVVFLIFYVIGVGAPASAVRAGIMGFLALFAKHVGRLNSLSRAVWLTAIIMIAYHPAIVRDDIGFQLSFLAILSIAYLYPIFSAHIERLLARQTWAFYKTTFFRGGVDVLLITIAAQLFTWPVIAYNFGQISLIAPLANLLVLWTSNIVMVGGLVAIFIATFLPALSVLIFLPLKVVLYYTVLVAKIFSKVPHAAIYPGKISYVLVFAYYSVIIVLLVKVRMMRSGRELEY